MTNMISGVCIPSMSSAIAAAAIATIDDFLFSNGQGFTFSDGQQFDLTTT